MGIITGPPGTRPPEEKLIFSFDFCFQKLEIYSFSLYFKLVFLPCPKVGTLGLSLGPYLGPMTDRSDQVICETKNFIFYIF